jgi:hypothetical protein
MTFQRDVAREARFRWALASEEPHTSFAWVGHRAVTKTTLWIDQRVGFTMWRRSQLTEAK